MDTPTRIDPVAPVIQVNSVSKQFGNGAVTALEDISLELRQNEFTAFVGPSGCGKTTMLRIIAGLEHPTRGRVRMSGDLITGPSPNRGMLFQAYTSFPWLTARKNVEYGMKLIGLPKADREARALDFLRLVRLEKVADEYPGGFSGGMKQRVALARTLAQNPSVLLMDEPFGALDAQVRWEMQELMVELIERERKTVVAVTHDIEEAIYLADRIIFFSCQPGRVKADLRVEFKQGRRFTKKEDLLVQPGYAQLEQHLFAMMREEIRAAAA